MGFIQGCNICNTPKEIGELKADNRTNNSENSKARKAFEIRLRNHREASILSENSISKIITHINASANEIDFPTEILSEKPKNAFKTGVVQFRDGDRFQGYVSKNFTKDGFGTYIKANGYIFKGLWKNNEIGDYTCIIDPEGNYFKGKLVNGQANGNGEMVITKRIKYKGNFTNNLPNQKGILENYIDNSIYEGELDNGVMSGKGILKFKDGTIYEGNFFNNKYEGFGKLKFKNGNIYEGNFHKNFFNGKGKYIYNDGKIFEGEFQMGLKYGFGKLSWSSNKYFDGFWINNKQHGEGIFYNNGDTLKVLFRYGKIIMKLEKENILNNKAYK